MLSQETKMEGYSFKKLQVGPGKQAIKFLFFFFPTSAFGTVRYIEESIRWRWY